MTEFIPVSLVAGWIHDLTSIVKGAAQEAETPTDLLINKGLRQCRKRLGRRFCGM